MNQLRAFICVATVITFAAFPALAVVLPPSDDSTTTSITRARKGGKSVTLNVSATARSWVEFDLSALPATVTGDQVASALLRIYITTIGKDTSFSLALPTGAWDEETLTDATAPTVGPVQFLDVPVPAGAKKSFVTLDVTAIVQGWVDAPETNHGFVFMGKVGKPTLGFDSKENLAAGHYPQIDVTLVTVPGPKGDKGDKGDPGTSGAVGLKGDKGDTGSQGLKGDTGATGAKGDTGLQGLKGDTGSQGPAGTTGPGTLLASSTASAPSGYSGPVTRLAAWSQSKMPIDVGYAPAGTVVSSSSKLYFRTDDSSAHIFWYEYDPSTQLWGTITDEVPTHGSFLVINDKIYALGPSEVYNQSYYRIDVLDPVNKTWTRLADAPSKVKYAAVVNGKIYGFYTSGSNMLVFNPLNNNWTTLPSIVPAGVTYGSGGGVSSFVGATNGKLYLFNLGDSVAHEYDPIADSWQSKAGVPSLVRQNSIPRVCAGNDGRIYFPSGGSRTMESYEPGTNTWQDEPIPQFPSSSAGLTSVNGILYWVAWEDGTLWQAALDSFKNLYIKK